MDPRVLDELGRHRHGIVTHASLLDAGTSRGQVQHARRRGLLIPMHRGVYRIAGTAQTWRQEVMAAVAAGEPNAFASHRTATALHPLPRTRGGVIEIVSEGHERLQRTGQRRHRTLDLPAADQWIIDGIPATALNRTLIDVGRYWDADRVGFLLDHAIRQGLTTMDAFADRVGALGRRGRNGIGVARRVLDDRGVDSTWGFESAMARTIRSGRLPTPTREWLVETPGRRYYIDFAYPDARLGIECDSTTWHTLPHQIDADLVRQNAIVRTGVLLLRYTRRRLRDDADDVVDEIRHHLRNRS